MNSVVKFSVSRQCFVDEEVLRFIDEGVSLHDPVTGITRNVGVLGEKLADALNQLCADGVTFEGVGAVCSALCTFVSVVEEASYLTGATAQRDGKEIVRTQTVDERRWNSVAIDDDFENLGG